MHGPSTSLSGCALPISVSGKASSDAPVVATSTDRGPDLWSYRACGGPAGGFGTVFGVATSLGLGVSQMAAGLNVLFGISDGIVTKLTLILVISVIATVSAVSGVGNGIRIISEWNIWLSIILLATFVAVGPFQWLMSFFVTSIGDYLWNFIPRASGQPVNPACGLAGRMDHLLLGMVDILGTLCRHVHRPDSAVARFVNSWSVSCSSDDHFLLLAVHVWR